MNKFLATLLVATWLLTGASAQVEKFYRDFFPTYRAGEVLVLCAGEEEGFFFVLDYGLQGGFLPIRFSPEYGLIRFKFPTPMTMAKAIDYFKQNDMVQIVQPNYCYSYFDVPNDTMYGQQWGFPLTGVETFWDFAKGASNVNIAIVDSGVDMNHPDLKDKASVYVSQGYDFGEDDADPSDNQGHGTHVAGIAAATTNNGLGVAGTGRQCHILPVKIADANGVIDTFSAYLGMWYASQAPVVNCSWGGAARDPILELVFRYVAGGTVVVAAAGNTNTTNLRYPAAFPNVLAVGAIDSTDQRWVTNATSGSNFGANWVDVAAPGRNILSTRMGGGYEHRTGTSMAAPFVAGLLAAFESYCGDPVEAVVSMTATGIPNGWTAFGRIDAAAMATYIPAGLSRTDYAPHTIFMTHGVGEAGGLPEVSSSDGIYYEVQGYDYYGNGSTWVGRYEAQFKVQSPKTVKQLWLHVDSKLGDRDRNYYTVWLLRHSDGKWLFGGTDQQWDGQSDRRYKYSTNLGDFIDAQGRFHIQIQFENWGNSDPRMFTDRLKLSALSQ
ncbi:MAG: hypothetical protein HONBIEJF_00468 [Fimbriimonadaceae bacterium]|nr:hypothetical protein [Fimbriimonadaceae bacterium]